MPVPSRLRIIRVLFIGAVIIVVLVVLWHEQWLGVANIFRNESPDEIVEIEGIPCYGHVEYYSNGALKRCTLAREDTLSGQPLAEGTIVHFTREGHMDWCFLQEDTEIQGYLCRGQGHSWTTAFHANGQVELIWLARDEMIQGVPCRATSFWTEVFGAGAGVNFYENGRLKQCMLSKDFTIEGRGYKAGDRVTFDRNGRLIRRD